ncbi:MAG: class I SAM-dependent methyltransferase [Thermoplasmata archaeon]|nr:class I SAM-dependent methyltransferase [Thermoplasmata archaeon]
MAETECGEGGSAETELDGKSTAMNEKLSGKDSARTRIEYRKQHIKDMISLFHPELEPPLNRCDVLDVGTGWGPIARGLAPMVRYVKAIDFDQELLDVAKEKGEEEGLENIDFVLMSAFDMDEKDRYDIVILSDVLEHVEEQRRLMELCASSMKPGGIMYLSTNNKWWPVEGHKYLPFLSYLPRGLANRYVRLFNRGEDYEGYYLLGYGGLKRLMKEFPVNYTFKPPVDPWSSLYKFGTRLVGISPFFWRFSPVFQVIIKKRDEKTASR